MCITDYVQSWCLKNGFKAPPDSKLNDGVTERIAYSRKLLKKKLKMEWKKKQSNLGQMNFSDWNVSIVSLFRINFLHFCFIQNQIWHNYSNPLIKKDFNFFQLKGRTFSWNFKCLICDGIIILSLAQAYV